MQLTRRNFLKLGGLTSTTLIGGYLLSKTPNFINGSMISNTQFDIINPEFQPDVDIMLRAHSDTVPILDEQLTTVWRYTGETDGQSMNEYMAYTRQNNLRHRFE